MVASEQLSANLKGGFAEAIFDTNPDELSAEELLAWSSVHGLANLFVDGPIGKDQTRKQKLALATDMINAVRPAFSVPH